eukprot:3972393-Prymnesium_polylepis.1
MFRAADFDEDGVVDLRQFVQLESVKRYFETLQKREIASNAAKAAAAVQAASPWGLGGPTPPADGSAPNTRLSQWTLGGGPAFGTPGAPGSGAPSGGMYPLGARPPTPPPGALMPPGSAEPPPLSHRSRTEQELHLAMQMQGTPNTSSATAPPMPGERRAGSPSRKHDQAPGRK